MTSYNARVDAIQRTVASDMTVYGVAMRAWYQDLIDSGLPHYLALAEIDRNVA
jgi:hypothetical protein